MASGWRIERGEGINWTAEEAVLSVMAAFINNFRDFHRI